MLVCTPIYRILGATFRRRGWHSRAVSGWWGEWFRSRGDPRVPEAGERSVEVHSEMDIDLSEWTSGAEQR